MWKSSPVKDNMHILYGSVMLNDNKTYIHSKYKIYSSMTLFYMQIYAVDKQCPHVLLTSPVYIYIYLMVYPVSACLGDINMRQIATDWRNWNSHRHYKSKGIDKDLSLFVYPEREIGSDSYNTRKKWCACVHDLNDCGVVVIASFAENWNSRSHIFLHRCFSSILLHMYVLYRM